MEKRVRHMQAGTPYVSERIFQDEAVVEIRGNPMPGGGFVATFTDVTAFRRAEDDLIRSNETLEQRVADRTARLDRVQYGRLHNAGRGLCRQDPLGLGTTWIGDPIDQFTFQDMDHTPDANLGRMISQQSRRYG